MAIQRTEGNPHPPGTAAEASYEFTVAWQALRDAFYAEIERLLKWAAAGPRA